MSRATMPRTILHTITDAGFTRTLYETTPREIAESLLAFSRFPEASHCGRHARLIVETAKPLLAIAHPAARAALWAGIIQAIAVVCLG